MKVEILQKETYLQMIRNSVGSSLFRNVYAVVDGEKKDILQDGLLSCAFFVSTILNHFKLIDCTIAPHTGVVGLLKNMEKSGWQKTENLVPGCIIVWEEWDRGPNGPHEHLGFYIGDEEAVHHNDGVRAPIKQHYTYGVKDDGSPVRKITAIYTHPILED